MMASKFNAVSAVGTALQIDSLVQGIAFGIAAGINIFVVQYFGARDLVNMKKSFGLNVLAVSIHAVFWIILSLSLNTSLLGIFIKDQAVVSIGFEYLQFSCFSFLFSCLSMVFTFAFHSMKRADIPLFISIFVVIFHILLNYLLMFVFHLGVKGAGISMLLTQLANASCYIFYSYKTYQPFVGTFKQLFSFSFSFVKKVIKTVFPLVINEVFFGIGNSLFIVAYGSLGKLVMDAYYIGNQIANVFYTVVNAMSDAATAIIGYSLGKKEVKEAENEVNYFLGIASILAVLVVGIILISAPLIVGFFHVESKAAFDLSVSIIRVLSIRIAFRLFNVIVFASLRAGGDTHYLMFLDASLLWGVGLVVTYGVIYLLGIQNIVFVILLGQVEQLVRLFFGMKRVRSKKWMKELY